MLSWPSTAMEAAGSDATFGAGTSIAARPGGGPCQAMNVWTSAQKSRTSVSLQLVLP
jgi:hypothetical protein